MAMAVHMGIPIPTTRTKIRTPTLRTVMAEMVNGSPLPSWLSATDVPELVGELYGEVRKGHVLYGRKMQTLARSEREDDVLFEDIDTGDLWVVHLTWSRREKPPFPWASQIKDVSELAGEDEDVD